MNLRDLVYFLVFILAPAVVGAFFAGYWRGRRVEAERWIRRRP